jgi:hypothetical protein
VPIISIDIFDRQVYSYSGNAQYTFIFTTNWILPLNFFIEIGIISGNIWEKTPSMTSVILVLKNIIFCSRYHQLLYWLVQYSLSIVECVEGIRWKVRRCYCPLLVKSPRFTLFEDLTLTQSPEVISN